MFVAGEGIKHCDKGFLFSNQFVYVQPRNEDSLEKAHVYS